MTEYLPTKHKKRELTEKQQLLLSKLEEANYDPIEAARLAEYSNPAVAVKALRSELLEIAEDMIANSTMKAAGTLVDILETERPVPNIKEKIAVAKDLLDRAGLAKKELIDVNHKVTGGVFILPEKKVLEGEYETVPTDHT